MQEHEKKLQQRNLPPTPAENQRLLAENNALKQRLQETGSRGENELEQWRKVVEQEKTRADQAEKAAQVRQFDASKIRFQSKLLQYGLFKYRSFISVHNNSKNNCNNTFSRFKRYNNSIR